MAVLIDSDVLIQAERGKLDIQSCVKAREEEEFFLSVISASELLHGVHRAKGSKVKTRRSAFVEAILNEFPILPIDLTIARMHAHLWANLASKGTPMGLHDSWLAATCVAYGFTLATANLRDFKRVPGLTVEAWA